MSFAAGPSAGPVFARAVSTSASAETAVAELAADLAAIPSPDLLLLFISPHHAEEAARIARDVAAAAGARRHLAVTADAVIAGGREHERTPAVAALAASLPGVVVHPFAGETLEHAAGEGPEAVAATGELIGAGPQLRATILFADPFSTPINRLLPLLNDCRVPDREGRPAGAIVGGMASGGAKPEQNVLVLDGRVLRRGFAGVSLSGPVRVDTVVSQGCRGIGDNFVITRAKANVIYELGGRPALDVLRDLIDSLGQEERRLIKRGLFVGRVVSEYKERFGRGDYLIRNVATVDPNSGTIAVHDLVRIGQTIRFHIRDAQTAAEDLELLLDAQKLHGRPAGVLLISCTGRGRNLFTQPHHDVQAIQRAFASEQPGEQKAKGGRVLDTGARGVPLAGLFAGGEIGPVGEASYLHGHSACAVMFRP